MTGDSDPIREAHRQWLAHGWESAADGMSMITSLTRVQQLLTQRIEAELRPFGLSFARYEILRLLAFTQSGSMTMTRLGSLLQVHATSVTSAVSRLVDQGYVERLRRDHDRRVILASLTPQGREVVEQATDRLNAEVFEQPGLPRSGVRDLTALLGQLRTVAGDQVD